MNADVFSTMTRGVTTNGNILLGFRLVKGWTMFVLPKHDTGFWR